MVSARAPNHPSARWTLLLGAAVALFMVRAAGHYTVFDDEALSCRLYTLPPLEMLGALWHGEDPDPPLYYLLENAAVHLFGVGPLGLRGLSIACFLAGLAALHAAARAWYDRPTARIALLLAALHPAHLFFGFAARWYALMFLLVGVLLYCTARLADAPNPARRSGLAWALAAAAVCYTNYFGPLVAGLAWVAGVRRDRHAGGILRRWLPAALGAILLYLPWLPPLLREIGRFPPAAGSGTAFAATAARTAAALFAGNLASVSAWWVWIPTAVFVAAILPLLWRRRRRIGPMALVVFGCLAAGVASRTLIDKYVMVFSGPACLLAAAGLAAPAADPNARPDRSHRRLAGGALAVAWLGCLTNLMTGSHWSSLRWLDPFETAVSEMMDAAEAPPVGLCVLTHPSARYYYARLRSERSTGAGAAPSRAGLAGWRRALLPPDGASGEAHAAHTPVSILRRLRAGPVLRILTLRTAGFAEDAEWAALDAVLARGYRPAGAPRRYLADPDAAWKDRLDPAVLHPPWRIVVQAWHRR